MKYELEPQDYEGLISVLKDLELIERTPCLNDIWYS
jgi:hypothetical protein